MSKLDGYTRDATRLGQTHDHTRYVNFDFEVYEFKNGEWAYRVKAKNHEILVWSEGYESKSGAYRALDTFLNGFGVKRENVILKEVKYI